MSESRRGWIAQRRATPCVAESTQISSVADHIGYRLSGKLLAWPDAVDSRARAATHGVALRRVHAAASMLHVERQ